MVRQCSAAPVRDIWRLARESMHERGRTPARRVNLVPCSAGDLWRAGTGSPRLVLLPAPSRYSRRRPCSRLRPTLVR